jgi:hypothetical protein
MAGQAFLRASVVFNHIFSFWLRRRLRKHTEIYEKTRQAGIKPAEDKAILSTVDLLQYRTFALVVLCYSPAFLLPRQRILQQTPR